MVYSPLNKPKGVEKGWKRETDFLLNAKWLGFRRRAGGAGAALCRQAGKRSSPPALASDTAMPPVLGAACAVL